MKKEINDKNQHIKIPLQEIVPEYKSKNKLVRWLFNKRQQVASHYIYKIKPNKLLDIGCGDGSFIRRIKNKFPNIKVFGVDANPNIKYLNSVFKEKIFSQQDLLNLSFKKNSFDAIICLDVLEHIKNLNLALNEIKRVLNKDGYLITSEPTENFLYKSLRFLYKGTYSEKYGPGAGAHYWNAKKIDRFIKNNGFTKISSKKIPFFLPLLDLFHVNLYLKK
ncbi:MAG: class I SAM-dependent methyltransferase [Nanoarchaeota archaeon]